MADSPISRLVQQVTSDAHRIASKSSDDVQSYANQLQLGRNMRQNLDELVDELSHTIQAFHTALLQLEQEEYMDEELKALHRALTEFAPQAEALSHHLRLRHRQYIENQEMKVTASLNEAMGS